MDTFLSSCPVLFRLEYFYYVAGIVAITVILTGVILYAMQTTTCEYAPTIGEMMINDPQARIFGVGMTFEAVFILCFGLIRDHIIMFMFENAGRINQFLCRVLLRITRFLIILVCVSLVILACCPVSYNEVLHNISSALFFIGLFMYFSICDFLTWKMNQPIKIASVTITAVGIACAIIFAVLRYPYSDVPNKLYYGIGAGFEYVAVFCAFIKTIILKQEMPSHGIRISRNMFSSDGKDD